ncbi:MAG: hypothetical protein Q7J04_09390 [Microcella sp.]|nr:hypothetical protein [Microcella sp.]
MSPISSEAAEPGQSSAVSRVAATSHRLRAQRALRGFERTFWILTGVLAIISAVFLLLGTLQGPKLSSAVVDPQRVTEQAGTQLRLFANQPLAEVTVEQVTVTPPTPVTVSVQDDLLVVQFDQRLRYSTEYTVEVRDVGATSRDATADFTHRFTTAPGAVLYLDRDEAGDEVLRAPLLGSGRGEVVVAAEGIQRFAPVEGVIVLARDDAAGGSLLESVQPGPGGAVEQIQLPPGVRVQQLIAPPVGTLLGVLLTSVPVEGDEQGIPPFSNTLAVIDLAGDRAVTPIVGLDGTPISAITAQFLPDGTTLIVHALDQSVLQVDLAGSALVLPIDQVPTVYGLSTDARKLTGSDSFGALYLDLGTGEEVRLNPSLFEGDLAFGGEVRFTAGELWVQKVAIPDATGGSFRTLLVADDGSGASRLLLSTIDDRGSLGSFVLSPNDQFVAIEVTPSVTDAVPDGRRVNGRPTSITTVIVDIETGAVVRTLEGFSPVW